MDISPIVHMYPCLHTYTALNVTKTLNLTHLTNKPYRILTFWFESIGIADLLASILSSIKFMFKICAIELQTEKKTQKYTYCFK